MKLLLLVAPLMVTTIAGIAELHSQNQHIPVAGAGTNHYSTGLAAHELSIPIKNCSANGSNANAGGQSETSNPFHLQADNDNGDDIDDNVYEKDNVSDTGNDNIVLGEG
jgi:hypothetical protein